MVVLGGVAVSYERGTPVMNARFVFRCMPPREGGEGVVRCYVEGRCKATWKREFKLPWREAGPPNHLNDHVDSDQ